jgi:hypothetical protein
LTSKTNTVWLVKETEDGYLAHKIDTPGAFVAIPETDGSWKPFPPEKKQAKEG